MLAGASEGSPSSTQRLLRKALPGSISSVAQKFRAHRYRDCKYKTFSQACAAVSLASSPVNDCLERLREHDARQSSFFSGYGSAHLTGSNAKDSQIRAEISAPVCIVKMSFFFFLF